MMKLATKQDQELINLYIEGNERAFEELLMRHKDRIYTTIYMFVKDQSQADDLFQDVFIKIIDTLRKGKYNHEGKFVQWAIIIAYNLCVDQFRRAKRRNIITPTESFDVFNLSHIAEISPEDDMIQNQSYRTLKALVDQLPPEQREVIILRHYAGMSFKEISALTRVSINTALGRMRYALINIRKAMTEKEVLIV